MLMLEIFNKNFVDYSIDKYVLSYWTINLKQYLIFNNKKYLFLPEGVFFFKKQKILTFFSINTTFLENTRYFFKDLQKVFSKKLILKGLGLRVGFASGDKNFLELKLGFSHLVKIQVPQGITVKISKNAILAYSFNLSFLGNFLYKVRYLKKPNAYKGKGIWYKNETKLLKIIKKS